MKSPAREFSTALLRLALRIFFRRIETAGAENIPDSGPAIFVLNHPNGLVDPLFRLCFSPRPVSFLAKAPLFRMPVVGFFVRALGSIPVYRRQDPDSDVSRNRETFARARELLSAGGVLALFPEGASHDEPRLLSLKTGAARIALGVAGGHGLRIVPAGLYYAWKSRFRSGALVSFAEPLRVDPVALNERGDPPREAVRELTRRIEDALTRLTLQAESREALDLVRRAERIFSIPGEGLPAPLSQELDLRRRFAAGASRLAQADPERFVSLRARIVRFEAERKAAGLPLDSLAPEILTPRSIARAAAGALASAVLLPLAALGSVIHYPSYRLAGFLADRFARGEEDQVATIKAISAMFLFPAAWAACAAAAWILFGPRAGAAAALLAPLSGYSALRVRESLDLLIGRGRAFLYALSRGYAVQRLQDERRAIHEEIVRTASELDLLPASPLEPPA